MDKDLIIARYNEDLSWLKEFKDFKIIVYNKGDKLSENLFYEVINLENKGRESHTWLHHIVKNYYNFLQYDEAMYVIHGLYFLNL